MRVRGVLVAALGLWALAAEAATYYVAPSGSGTACTQAAPCALGTGLSQAGAGDEVVLQDGVYDAVIETRANGVTVLAEHRHQAIVRSTSAKRLALIQHSDTTLRSIRFDGLHTLDAGKGALVVVKATDHIVIEDTIIEHSHGAGIAMNDGVSDIVVRHNLIQETGFSAPGEAMYLGEADSVVNPPPVLRVEIYGNTFRRFTQNGIDLKPNTKDAQVHHNIFEGQHFKPQPFKPDTEGTIVTRSNGAHRIHDNIFRDSPRANPSPFHLAARGGHRVYANVLFNMTSEHAISTREPGSGSAASEIFGNTFCDMSSYSIQNPDGMDIHDNPGLPGGAPQAACDAEVARILDEMRDLPTSPRTGDLDGDGQVTLADLRLLVQMLLGQAPGALVLTGQATPSAEAKALAAPADRLTLGDVRVLMEIPTGG